MKKGCTCRHRNTPELNRIRVVGNTTEITVNADYGVEVEYGTRYTKPRPYFRNNVRLAKQRAKKTLNK